MNGNPVDQKNLPSTQVKTVIVLLLVPLTFYLYGFYWLDKQSSKLRQQFGVCPFNESFIKYGYISFGITIFLLVLLDTYQVENVVASYLSALLALIMYTIFLYCSFCYALTIRKVLGYKKIDFWFLLGVLSFNVIFINWWQNKQAQ